MNRHAAVSEYKIYPERRMGLYICQKFVHRLFLFNFTPQSYYEIAYFPNIYKFFLFRKNYFHLNLIDNCVKVITLQLY